MSFIKLYGASCLHCRIFQAHMCKQTYMSPNSFSEAKVMCIQCNKMWRYISFRGKYKKENGAEGIILKDLLPHTLGDLCKFSENEYFFPTHLEK